MSSRYFLGLLGHPLGHSYSPLIHRTLLDLAGLKGDYKRFDYTLADLEAGAISKMIMSGVHGFNVTIPYKVLLHDKLAALTPSAKRVGAVNTVFRVDVQDEISLIGHNTDSSGFYKSLRPETQDRLAGGHALVLGGGGSARAILAALLFEAEQPVQQVMLVMRSPQKGIELMSRWQGWLAERGVNAPLYIVSPDTLKAETLQSVDAVINCTPVGMHPEPNASPLDLTQIQKLSSHAHVIDLIYNPQETALMQLASAHGCPVVQNGLGMLIHQAIEAFCTWTKLPAEAHWYEEVERQVLATL